MNREEPLIRNLDSDKEKQDFKAAGVPVISPEKPRAHPFHFIEFCGGSGKVTRAMDSKGWVVGPVLGLDSSPFFNLRSLELLRWGYPLLEEGLLDSFLLHHF